MTMKLGWAGVLNRAHLHLTVLYQNTTILTIPTTILQSCPIPILFISS